MIKSNSLFDFREYIPASVLIIDLVGFSKKGPDTVSYVHSHLERSFGKVVERLQIENIDLSFSFTGDGYVLSLFRRASSRMMDFLIALSPYLKELKHKYSQEFRMGVSYGLLSLSYNSLTKRQEHFDDPGILSARLEQVANSGEILVPNLSMLFSQDFILQCSLVRLVGFEQRIVG